MLCLDRYIGTEVDRVFFFVLFFFVLISKAGSTIFTSVGEFVDSWRTRSIAALEFVCGLLFCLFSIGYYTKD